MNSDSTRESKTESNGQNNNENIAQEVGRSEEPISLRYTRHLRKSYGIDKISKAGSLKKLRSENRDLHNELSAQVADMEASIDNVPDALDRLAMVDEIKLVNGQLTKLDTIHSAINDQVTVLLSA
jgi:hypothetical protein